MARKIDAETAPSLLMRMRAHDDEAAWADFVDIYSPLIYEYCRSANLQASDAADVTQEVLLRVASGVRKLDYDRRKGMFRDWLARIVNNEIRRQFAKSNKTPRLSEGLDDRANVANWNDRFHKHVFDVALSRCKPQFSDEVWVLFERSWLTGTASEVVAAEEGVGIEKVYLARSRVLKRLKYEVALLADDLL